MMWRLIFCVWCSTQAVSSVHGQSFCGTGDHYLTENYEVITSHAGFANNHSYGRNFDCVWKIQAPVGMKVELVARSFDLEYNSICENDYLMLYDGMDTNSTSFGKFCGRFFKPIASTGRYMTLRFVTDNTISAGGFSIYYHFITSSNVSDMCGLTQFQCANGKCIPGNYRCDNMDDCGDDSDEQNCDGFAPPTCSTNQFNCHTIQGCIPLHWMCDGDDDCGNNADEIMDICSVVQDSRCGAKIRYGITGTLSSPNYPGVFDNNMHCLWRIQAPNGTNNLKIKFDDNFHLEVTTYDNVTLYSDGKTHTQGPFGGDTAPASFTMPGDHVFVEFKSDHSHAYAGFQLDWKASI